MENNTGKSFNISHVALSRAMGLVPKDLHGEFALRLLGLGASSASVAEPEAEPVVEYEDDEVHSYPLSVIQARLLISKLDKKTVDLLKAMVANPNDGVCTIDWKTVKTLTDVSNWAQFAKGRLGGTHRALRGITMKSSAILIWQAEGWKEDGMGDYKSGTIGIDGPAIRSLQVALEHTGDLTPG